jgi:hypothetical protein
MSTQEVQTVLGHKEQEQLLEETKERHVEGQETHSEHPICETYPQITMIVVALLASRKRKSAATYNDEGSMNAGLLELRSESRTCTVLARSSPLPARGICTRLVISRFFLDLLDDV